MEYELLFFTSVANEDRIGEIKKEIVEILESQGGKISVDFSDIGKRKFAHPIKKQTHGFFSFCRFTLDETENIPEIGRRLAMNDKLMRHIIVRAAEIGKQIGAQAGENAPARNVSAERNAPRHETVRHVSRNEKRPEIEKKTEAQEAKLDEAETKVGMKELDDKLSELLEENQG
ncbi:MAG: 30S ribosomal protein S6 [Parcubacteria group bacterium]|jgi:ribosomal protein S6